MPDFRGQCIQRIERHIGCELVRREPRKKTTCVNKGKKITVICLVSRSYDSNDNSGDTGFWFKFCSPHRQNLLDYKNGYVGLGCGTKNNILLIPKRNFTKLLISLPSVKQKRLDYFLRIEKRNNEFFIDTRQEVGFISVQKYLI